jgi:hypothetical protein
MSFNLEPHVILDTSLQCLYNCKTRNFHYENIQFLFSFYSSDEKDINIYFFFSLEAKFSGSKKSEFWAQKIDP